MAYAISKNSIFRRCLALVMCCCLLLCVAVPRARADGGIISVPVAAGLLIASVLVAFGFMDITGTGESFAELITDLVNKGIDLSFFTSDAVYETESLGDDVYYVDTALVQWVQDELLNGGYFYDGSFTYTVPDLSDGDVISSYPYGVASLFQNVACSLDPAFASYWDSESASFMSSLYGSPWGAFHYGHHGVDRIQFIKHTDSVSFAVTELVDPDDGSVYHYLDGFNSDGEYVDSFEVMTFSLLGNASDGFYWSQSTSIKTPPYAINLNPFISISSVDALYERGYAYVSSIGTVVLDEFEYVPPVSIPVPGTSVVDNFPEWVSESDSSTQLPLSVPDTLPEVVQQTQSQAQTVTSSAVKDYSGLLGLIVELLRSLIEKIGSHFASLAATVVAVADALGLDVAEWGQAIVDAVNGFKTTFVSGFNQWMQRLQSAMGTVKTAVDNMSTAVVDGVGSIYDSVNNFFTDGLPDFFGDMLADISTLAVRVVGFTQNFFGSLTNTLSSFWGNTIDTLKDWYEAFIEFINSFFANLRAALEGVIAPVLEGILALPGYIMQLPDYIAAWFGRAKDIIADGFGFSSIWHYVVSWIGCISGFVGVVLGIWGKLPYCMVVPVYACVVLTIVFGLYRRFIR